jgi:hypothetical protein
MEDQVAEIHGLQPASDSRRRTAGAVLRATYSTSVQRLRRNRQPDPAAQQVRDQVHPVGAALVDLAPGPGPAWRRVGSGALGELDTRVLLEQWLRTRFGGAEIEESSTARQALSTAVFRNENPVPTLGELGMSSRTSPASANSTTARLTKAARSGARPPVTLEPEN